MANYAYHFYATGPSNLHNYSNPDLVSPHYSQPGSPLPQTQPSITSMQPTYGGNRHSPCTAVPHTPDSVHNLSCCNSQGTETGQRGGSYPVAQSQYPPFTVNRYSQPIESAPAGGRGPLVLRFMPPEGFGVENSVCSHDGARLMMPQDGIMGASEQPTHVVGSKGRRGILPSAPGRPAAPAAGTSAAKNTVIPVKDGDGKFPCPYCTKTYVNFKHMKRHVLRHTGVRPYMCVLCSDTFTRSDILKRHFQKCSIRRGNPTGATHLSQPKAHARK